MFTRRPRAKRSLVSSLASLGLALLLGFSTAGCGSAPNPRAARAIEPPRTVSFGSIMGKPAVDPEMELESLARARSIPALLRRANLELLCRRPQAAIDAAAEVLYGATKPSPNEEAFARYLRAEGYAQQGKPERGAFDLDRARELAMDSDLQRLLRPRAQPTEAGEAAAAPSVAVQGRSSWSPRPADRSNLEPLGKPARVTIHHSAMYFRDTRPAACAAQIQQIQREHMGNRGYGDIGYHFLIDPAGRIWEGRELRWQGAHASGENNRQNIGICVLGNFLRGRGGQGPTPAQVGAMRQLVVDLMQRYRFGPDDIHCHSDFKPTACPGPLMETVVAQLIDDLQHGGSTSRLAAAAAQH